MKNKIYINGNLGAVIEDDELVGTYDTIHKLETITDSNGVVYLGIYYTYEGVDEDEDLDGNMVYSTRDFEDYSMYEWNKYDISIKNIGVYEYKN